MSVGGVVIEALPCVVRGEERVWINTREPQNGDECAIYVEASPEARSISEGDSVWWQGGWAMWTPRRSVGRRQVAITDWSDRKLRRIGCSGVNRPPRSGKDGST